jgi:F-type H+-transporting ATPase subunit b
MKPMTPKRMAGGLLVLFGSTVPVLAASGGGGGGAKALMEPHIGTIFWTLITFLVLAFLLGKVAWKPLLGALDAREKSIEDSLDQARNERDEAQKLLEEHKALVAQAHRERADALTRAEQEAEKLKSGIMDEARDQREKLLAQSREQVEAGLKQARAELQGLAVDLAIQAATKLLEKNVDDPTQRKLVEDHLADLERRSGQQS